MILLTASVLALSTLTFTKAKNEDFLWGTATASYQGKYTVKVLSTSCQSHLFTLQCIFVHTVEGAFNEDGRGMSVWDSFSHTPGKLSKETIVM